MVQDAAAAPAAPAAMEQGVAAAQAALAPADEAAAAAEVAGSATPAPTAAALCSEPGSPSVSSEFGMDVMEGGRAPLCGDVSSEAAPSPGSSSPSNGGLLGNDARAALSSSTLRSSSSRSTLSQDGHE
jgi:hypothetical protein